MKGTEIIVKALIEAHAVLSSAEMDQDRQLIFLTPYMIRIRLK